MAAREELLENLGESYGYINIMLDRKIEQMKLNVAERSATTISGLITTIILGLLGGLSSLFGLIALAFYLAGGENTSIAFGFSIVALVLLVLLVLIFLLRRQLIVNPSVRKIIGVFFNEAEKQ